MEHLPKTTDMILGVALGVGHALPNAPASFEGNLSKTYLALDWLVGACIALACCAILFPDAFGTWAVMLAFALQSSSIDRPGRYRPQMAEESEGGNFALGFAMGAVQAACRRRYRRNARLFCPVIYRASHAKWRTHGEALGLSFARYRLAGGGLRS